MEDFVFRARIAAVHISYVYFLSFVTMWSIVVYIRIRIMQIWRKEGLTGLLQIIYLKNVTLFTIKCLEIEIILWTKNCTDVKQRKLNYFNGNQSFICRMRI